MKVIDLQTLYEHPAQLTKLVEYESKACKLAGEGNDITLTGAAPIWLYLRIAHALHGKARRLFYDSPVSDKVLIFDHNPF